VPPPPTVSGFVPAAGIVGSSVTVAGAGFTGATAVAFNGTAAPTFHVVSDTQLTVTVPVGATTGPIAVTTANGTGISTADFTVTLVPPPTAKPTIATLSPTSGKRGATITITGKAFGKKRAASFVTFGATKCTRYLSWSTTRIRCTVPAKALLGKVGVRVSTAAGRSNVKTFTVRR
jgi:hypothetical protein